MDWRLARLLASEVIEAEPFTVMGEEALAKATASMSACGTVIDTGVPVRETNRVLEELRRLAEESGKLRRLEELV